MNRHLPTLIFSHGNSFPASTYKVLFTELRRRGFKVKALEKFGHDPHYPVSNNWPHLVQELADFASHEVDKSEGPVFLVGHSLGGFLSLMTAARHPHLAHGVLLLDSPVLGGWRATTVGVAKTTQLIGNVSPASISRLRRTSWASQEEALAHFASKKIFARWAPEVLHDYVAHGTHDDAQGRRVLSFNREIETALYNTVPDNMERVLKRHPLKCPAAYMGGLHSVEMRQVGMALTHKVTKGRISMLDGSHLFPMEQPLATAAAMEAALLNLHQVRLHGKH